MRALLGSVLLMAAGSAVADRLTMPRGMGGVPDIGAIPCSVFNQMLVVAPFGTRHSLVTWSAGYVQARSGKSLQEAVTAAGGTSGGWTYDRIAGDLEAFCAANPGAVTGDAAASVAKALQVAQKSP